MEHVEEVRPVGGGDRMSHWKIKGPLGKTVEFDAELVTDEPGRQIGWSSRGGEMETSGAVTFADLDVDTEVHGVMQWYDTPGGAGGEAICRMFQSPEKMLEEDLQRFRDIVEGRVGSGTRR
jgi:uncharacterized membrane protein